MLGDKQWTVLGAYNGCQVTLSYTVPVVKSEVARLLAAQPSQLFPILDPQDQHCFPLIIEAVLRNRMYLCRRRPRLQKMLAPIKMLRLWGPASRLT
jgi:hypothetical protein